MGDKWTAWEQVKGYGLDFEEVIYEKKYHAELEGAVARVTVNRPKKYNAFTNKTMDEMFKAFYEASSDPLVGIVVLTGAGDHFGTGGDIEWEVWGLREQFWWKYAANRLVRLCRKPVLAAVKGYCIGGSHHLAYCCDFTIAADTAIMGQNGPRVSSPADGFIMPYLTHVVGAKKAREIWMLCRRYTAHEALEMGLVNKVVPVEKMDEEIDRWCEEVLLLSPACVEILKASFDSILDSLPSIGVTGNMLYPNYLDTPEGREGSTAFMERRPTRFWKIRKAEAEKKKEAQEELMKRFYEKK
ncbi:MAG: enoyl-CoA hydratase-related protein [Syntrophales bacterium]